jgi:hypothetical protein
MSTCVDLLPRCSKSIPTAVTPAPREASSGQAARPEQRTAAFPSWREWRWFLLQAALVVAIELSDDLTRGFFLQRPVHPTQVNAERVMHLEQHYGLWIEPGVQRAFEHGQHLFGALVHWSDVVLVANMMYGIAHGLVTAVVAAWVFWRRRGSFPFVRNVFLLSTAMSVLIYNAFPVAPPRLATGLTYRGRPFHFVDTVFQGGGVDLSFDQYAAMPSLHIVWALIAGLALVCLARSWPVRLYGLCYPLLMTWAVVVTGNHYLADCIGGAVVVAIAAALVRAASSTTRAVPGARGRYHERAHTAPPPPLTGRRYPGREPLDSRPRAS